jgi:competence protein ComEA
MVTRSNVARSHNTALGPSIAFARREKERCGLMLAALTSWIARLRASSWAPFLTRGVPILGALFFFSLVGRSAMCSERGPPANAMGALDASAVAVATAPAVVAVDGGARACDPSPSPAASAIPGSTTTITTATTARGRATPDDPVYLNEAGAEELRRLPGVGAKRAEAILAHRRHVGRFSRVEDLLRVKGIGRGTLKKWRPLVRFEVRANTGVDGGGSGA